MSLFTAKTVEEVKELIALGHDVNIIDQSSNTVLHYACKKGNLDIVKVLCEAGANVNKMTLWNCFPIDEAVEAGYLDVIKYLIENYPVDLNNVLYCASIKGNIDVLDYLLTLNLELDSSSMNPLIIACSYGHIDVIDKLLYAGANTNIVDNFGSTVLTVTTSNSKLDIIKRLVMFGADYHTYGGESLHYSCEFERNDISEFLIDLGCNPNHCVDNMTSLMYACVYNNLKIIKLLLERGADPHFVNNKGKKAIDYCKSEEARALFIKN